MEVPSKLEPRSLDLAKGTALRFVVLLGVVSLFADMTYEGARSITGPYLAVLGASATVVGIVAGFGELIGYGLRLVSGYLSDRTGRYWAITLVGYAVNMLAVPLLALAGNWEIAALLMIAERTGKAIRTPARDAMLSHATSEMGRGWGFGLHEAMDQIGAVLGPLIVAAVLYVRGDYQTGFALLLIPALLALGVLVAARLLYPHPRDLEVDVPAPATRGFPRVFWLYLAAVALIAAGYADFPLIAY
ncbi:MAG TPA: MFS transporter, partial [Roseiflexaceae bacterium]